MEKEIERIGNDVSLHSVFSHINYLKQFRLVLTSNMCVNDSA